MDFRHVLNVYALQYGEKNFLTYLDNDIALILNDNNPLNYYISQYLLDNEDIVYMLHTNGHCNTTYHEEFLVNLWDHIDFEKQKELYNKLLFGF